MPELTPVTLTFHGGLHVGLRGLDLAESAAYVPSDTLFAALLDAWRRSGQTAEDFAAPFTSSPNDPPFLLTSAFPQAGAVRFFPMPQDVTILLSPEKLRDYGKTLKGVRYLSEKLLRAAAGGQTMDSQLFPKKETEEPEGNQGLALQGGSLWLAKEEMAQLPDAMHRKQRRLHSLRHVNVWSNQQTPRVTVSRITSASNIFHAGRVSFAAGCGLWFGVQWRKPDMPVPGASITYRDAFSAALSLLEHDGLGGERTSGYGAFTHSKDGSFHLDDPGEEKLTLLLCRYMPREDELQHTLTAEGTAYAMSPVEGWLRSPDQPAQRRRLVYMLTEGSAIHTSSALAGRVENVRPAYANDAPQFPHPVYRYGLALGLGWPRSARTSTS